jgi:hypothetical protein
MSSPVIIERIGRQKRDLGRFFDVAEKIQGSDRNWIAPLRSDLAKMLSPENPFFRHAEIQLFLARRGAEAVGRIAAILDRHHNDFHAEKTAFFGFFESVEDPEAARVLFEAASLWARERRMETLRGPANPSLNDEAGLLVEGFESPPAFMMPYNPAYYVALVEGAGFRKAKDLLAYWFDISPAPAERLGRLAERVKRAEPNIVLRPITRRSLARDLPLVREVYNEAWEKNWGFVPMTSEEMDFMAHRLKPLLDADFVWLAEAKRENGSLEPVGFFMTLPDYNQAIAKTGGRLLPFGWLRFLLAARRIRTLRVVTLGIKERWRMRGLNAVLFDTGLRTALRRGFTGCEVSWLLEDNDLVIRAVDVFGGHRYKTYRLYDLSL